jgi:molecular chaperone DnaK
MMQDAEANASSDKARKEKVEAKNHADSAVYETEKSLREHGDKVDSSTKSSIEEELKKVKDLMAKEDSNADELKSATEKLMQNSMKLGEAIYKASQASSSSSQSAENSSSTQGQEANNSSDNDQQSGKVVDAEYEEIKEEKEGKK